MPDNGTPVAVLVDPEAAWVAVLVEAVVAVAVVAVAALVVVLALVAVASVVDVDWPVAAALAAPVTWVVEVVAADVLCEAADVAVELFEVPPQAASASDAAMTNGAITFPLREYDKTDRRNCMVSPYCVP